MSRLLRIGHDHTKISCKDSPPLLPCHHLSPFPTARRASSGFQSVCQRCSTDQHIGMQARAAQLPSWPSTWIPNMSSQLCLPAPPGYAPWVQACTCKSENVRCQLICHEAIQVTRQFFNFFFLTYGILHKWNCRLLTEAVSEKKRFKKLYLSGDLQKYDTIRENCYFAQLPYIITGKSAGGERNPPNSGEETPRQAEQ